VVPNNSKPYKFSIRAANNKALTVPSAQIVSAVKSGTTTATITTATDHGLAVGDPVVIYGIRDQTNFPNLTPATAVASVPSSTTFTIVIGTASTVTSYGGYVAKVQGGNLMSALGALTMAAQSATIASGILTLVGSAAWSGVLIGDFVELVGIRDNTTGASLGIEGAWRVRDIATTNLVLEYVGAGTMPTTLATTNCGGGVIKRTDLRVSLLRIFDFERERVEMMTRPTGDIANAVPVVLQGGALTSGTVAAAGTVAVDAAIGNPVTAGLRASNANIAAMSAAGDNVGWLGTMIGAGIVKPYALPEAQFDASLALTTTTAAAIAAAAGAGIKRHLVAVQAINTGAAVVDLIVLDGAAERWRLPLPVNVPVDVEFPTHLTVTAATALNANLSAAGTVRANFQGYTAP
jgi:hypothetical protein